MAYQMYRNTTLGMTLQDTLDELIQNGQISSQLALKIMTVFDKVINRALSTKIKTRVQFKAEQLTTYRFCDNVWTFVMENVEFRDTSELLNSKKVKIVACDGRAASNAGASSSAGTQG